MKTLICILLWVLLAVLDLCGQTFSRTPAFLGASKVIPAAGGGGPTTLFTDDFNRADGTDMGTNWTEGGPDAAVAISGNAARLGSGSGGLVVLATTTNAHAATADVTVSAKHITTGADGGPCARITDSDVNPTMYALDAWANTLSLQRYNNSSGGTELATASITFTAGAAVKLEVSGSGATVTLKGYYNGSLIINTNDTSGSRITSAGQAGIHAWSPATASDRDWDDFSVTTP